MLASDKHSSLLRTFVNYGGRKFYNIGSCTINVLFGLAFSSVINHARKWHHNLERQLMMMLVIIYDQIMFITQDRDTGLQKSFTGPAPD
jgi:hypothetical protein